MKRGNEDSSLELLLDTMCNAFGGVMFIAILLSVMVAIRPVEQDDPVPEQDPQEKIEDLQQQITKLNSELENRMKKTQEQAERLKEMNSDPRLKLIQEIALAERIHKEKQVQQKILTSKVNLIRSTLENLRIQTEKCIEERKSIENKVKKQKDELKDKQEQLAQLKEKIDALDLKNMIFTTIVKKDETPYFIFVDSGNVWPIGPEINGEASAPAPAVTFQIKNGLYFCYPVPGKEIQIFSGDLLSQEFQKLVTTLPSDRVPVFVIGQKDASVFYRLREILKKQDIFHGFRVQSADQNYFNYQYINQGEQKYEY